ncbi:hypothetical protein V2I01_42060 [Micromonospora sp. BRA006-A]|nr:hypothetical protein [Micromonospora sp. BRA006-A]
MSAPVGQEAIRGLLPQRFPLLLVDRVVEVRPDGIVAEKAVTAAEWCYAGLDETTPPEAYAYPVALLLSRSARPPRSPGSCGRAPACRGRAAGCCRCSSACASCGCPAPRTRGTCCATTYGWTRSWTAPQSRRAPSRSAGGPRR